MEITDLLVAAQKNKASDLHLSTGNPPILRINGDILPIEMPPLEGNQTKQMVYAIMTDQQRSEYEKDLDLDFSITFGDQMRFRVNAYHTINGPAAVFRTIPANIQSLEDLKLPEILRRLCHLHKGLVLVTGPTGSGKSTTLAAMIHYINHHFQRHILTVEDPVEFVHLSAKSLINQREVGGSTRSFARALKSALREDPDIILVGELRDLETIHLALTAAETGHLVLATLHTSSAAKSIDRIIDVFPADEKEMVRAMLSVSLEAVIAQGLFKRADGTGRIAAHEIMLGTPAIRNLIRENKIPQIASMIQMGGKAGMVTMRDALNQLFANGLITADSLREALLSGNEEEGDESRKDKAASGGGSVARRAGSSGRESAF
jgi:twitching motility protein PilT